MPLALSASTWSFISEINGDTHQRQSAKLHRRQLVTERLPPARRHQHQRISFPENGGNDLLLQRQELVKAEMLFE